MCTKRTLFLIFFASFIFLSCTNKINVRFIENNDKDNGGGKFVFYTRGENFLRYIDLEKNESCVLNLPLKTAVGLYRQYDFFVEENLCYITNYIIKDNSLDIEIMIIPGLQKVDTLHVDSSFIKEDAKYYIKYFHDTNDLFIHKMGDEIGLVYNIGTKEQRSYNFNFQPYLCVEGKYYSNNTTELFVVDDSLAMKAKVIDTGSKFTYNNNANIVAYTKDNHITLYFISNKKFKTLKLTPLGYRLFEIDRIKYYVINKRCIIYATRNRNILLNVRAIFRELFSGGFQSDQPMRYYIYDYVKEKNIGYLDGMDTINVLFAW